MTLEKKRLSYRPVIPAILSDLSRVHFVDAGKKKGIPEAIAKHFPKTFNKSSCRLTLGSPRIRGALRLGVFFSGGPAAGGHNVIWGLFDALKKMDEEAQLIGFFGGAAGLIENRYTDLKGVDIAAYRNQGGFDLIETGRTKIETQEQMRLALNHCQEHRLDGLVVIGGDDSNTNAAHLAEYFLNHGCKTAVVGVPKTIDGDLRSDEIEITFGFDSACKTYSEMIGNICRDAKSMKKYYHFIKLMGRSASHIALECALSTQPNLTLIGEERKNLQSIVREIAQLIEKRSRLGKEYGVVLIPEGLIEFIPEIHKLIQELNRAGLDRKKLSSESEALLLQFPETIQKQLLSDRDPHGNVKVSQIETEKLILSLVRKEVKLFTGQEHFFGYEGRCCFPTNFDANYSYSLGLAAALAVRDDLTGVICSVSHLRKHPSDWEVSATPLVSMMRMEERKGSRIPVIQKALVDINEEPFVKFSRLREIWQIEDQYRYPGPIQFCADENGRSVDNMLPATLKEMR